MICGAVVSRFPPALAIAAVRTGKPAKYSPSPAKNISCSSGNKTGGSGVYAMEVPDQRVPTATFEDLALPLFDQLYNFARWLTQDRDEADDLVQETYAKALRGFSSFQAGTNFRAWMYRILRNSFLSSRTGLRSTVAFDEEEHLQTSPGTPNPEALLIEQVDREMMQQSLAELPVHFREILLLCEVEEMSYREIAETTGIPVGTVMSRLSQARRALRELLLQRRQGERDGM